VMMHRPSRAAPSNPKLVAILPFRTSGASSELAWLHEGLVDLLAAKLAGGGELRAAEPTSVLGAWHRVGGSESTADPQHAALEIARGLGAGRLIDGSVVGTPAHLTITASLRTASGRLSGSSASADGPIDSLTVLVDRLAGRLLSLDAGVDLARLSPTSSSLPATRAFLAGRAAFRKGDIDQAFRSFREATVLDSTFALAALELVHASVWVGGAWSEDAQRGKRLAQAGRERLGPGDRALLDAWDMDDITGPRWIQAWQAAAQANPERAETWYELGDAYFHNGALVGLDNPMRLATDAFQRGWAIDSANGSDSLSPGRSPIIAEPLTHMVEIAQINGDTASVRRLVAQKLGADSTSGSGGYLRWHRAIALGDSARRAFWADSEKINSSAWGFIHTFITWTGMGTRDLLRVTSLDTRHVEADHPGEISSSHALALLNGGRPREARRVLETDDDPTGTINFALYWGGDTAAAASAARRLTPLATAVARQGLTRIAAVPVDGHRYPGLPKIRAICAVAAWHAAHADYDYVGAAIGSLRSASRPGLSSPDSLPPSQSAVLCSALLEASRASALHLPDAGIKLARADVAARTYILSTQLASDLVVARIAEEQGDLALALRALRRRGAGFMSGFQFYLTTFLHEEGRLAALTGDTVGAIRAYQHYLALRPNPEPEVKPEVERVREELARLVGEHSGR
jgi:tetratricopeptide (TPR) repeat protein